MSALRVASKPLVAAARKSAVPVLPRRSAPKPLRSRTVMHIAFPDDDGMFADKPAAQHAPYKRLRSEYASDQLTHTVAGQYEWQIMYALIACSFLILPFIPGFTIFAKFVYEGVGGVLN